MLESFVPVGCLLNFNSDYEYECLILQTLHVRMVQFTWWEVIEYPEGELSTAMKGPGILCVPVAGMTMDMNHV